MGHYRSSYQTLVTIHVEIEEQINIKGNRHNSNYKQKT